MHYRKRPLARSFYARPTLEVAPELLGKILVHETQEGPLAARIVEVEAYLGQDDPASHAWHGPRGRAAIMYGPSGRLYVYTSYGMHLCMNVVANDGTSAGAILLRAAMPLVGAEQMAALRGGARKPHEIARGPGCLTQALAIRKDLNGSDLISGPVRLHHSAGDEPGYHVCRSPRIGISRAVERPWRYFLCGHAARSGPSRFNRCGLDAPPSGTGGCL